jgi:cold shock CspA family protein
MQGTIHRLIRGKGFGFIQVEDRQFFFHHTEVKDIEFKELVPGDVVSFNYVEDEQGRNPRAVEVVVVEKKEKPPRVPRGPRASAPSPQGSAPGFSARDPAAASRGAGVDGDGRSPKDSARGSHDSARGFHDGARRSHAPASGSRVPRAPRPPMRGPPRPRKPGPWRERAPTGSPDGFAPRPPEPGPSEDGGFTRTSPAPATANRHVAPGAPLREGDHLPMTRAASGRGPRAHRVSGRRRHPRAGPARLQFIETPAETSSSTDERAGRLRA